jgi:hypothetical protein
MGLITAVKVLWYRPTCRRRHHFEKKSKVHLINDAMASAKYSQLFIFYYYYKNLYTHTYTFMETHVQCTQLCTQENVFQHMYAHLCMYRLTEICNTHAHIYDI